MRFTACTSCTISRLERSILNAAAGIVSFLGIISLGEDCSPWLGFDDTTDFAAFCYFWASCLARESFSWTDSEISGWLSSDSSMSKLGGVMSCSGSESELCCSVVVLVFFYCFRG